MKKEYNLKFDQLFQECSHEALKGINQNHGGPFSAMIIDKNGKIISKAHNTVLKTNDPTCHAEVNAIRKACKKLQQPHLAEYILVASSEPCPMCLTTSYWAQIPVIYYAVSKKIAAQAGFDDAFIYQDLTKKIDKRRVKLLWKKEFEEIGKKAFQIWKKQSGKLY